MPVGDVLCILDVIIFSSICGVNKTIVGTVGWTDGLVRGYRGRAEGRGRQRRARPHNRRGSTGGAVAIQHNGGAVSVIQGGVGRGGSSSSLLHGGAKGGDGRVLVLPLRERVEFDVGGRMLVWDVAIERLEAGDGEWVSGLVGKGWVGGGRSVVKYVLLVERGRAGDGRLAPRRQED